VGFASALLVLGLTLARQKRLDLADLPSYILAYLSGNNIPPSFYLCYYVFDPDPPALQTKLHGFENYIALSGLCLLLVSIISIWTLCKKAWSR